jgi:hypothetical protein
MSSSPNFYLIGYVVTRLQPIAIEQVPEYDRKTKALPKKLLLLVPFLH